MGLENTKIYLVDDFETATDLFRWLGTVKSNVLAFDTETTGLSPEEDSVRLMQIGADDTAWAIPCHQWGGVFAEVVKRWDKEFVGHNTQYDVAMLRSEGIHMDVHRCHDTRLMGHVLDPTESTALKYQTGKYVDARAAALQSALSNYMTDSGYKWHDIPITRKGKAALYWQYGALDTILTAKLMERHYPLVQARSPESYTLELRASWALEKMMRRGVRVDREYTESQMDKIDQYVESCEAWTKENYGCSPGSNQAIAEALMSEGYGHLLTKTTASGRISLDEEVLTQFVKIGHPLAQVVMRRRQAQKVSSTYLRRFLEYSEFDGLLHPRINSVGGSGKSASEDGGVMGVRTGRMSMERPNLQQLSKKNKDNPFGEGVRNCIIPRTKHHRLVMFDLDQIEMRLLAHMSQDQKMLDAFNGGGDFFVTLTRNMFQDDTITKSDPRRGTVKTLSYGTAYGSGADKFAEVSGLPPAEARKMHRMFHDTFPGAKSLGRRLEAEINETRSSEGVGYVSSELTGRRFQVDEDRPYSIMNHLIQGTAAEVMKMMIVKADEAGLSDYMVLPVHDEIISDVPTTELADFIDTMKAVMNDTETFRVPVTSGGAVGERWGTKKDLED